MRFTWPHGRNRRAPQLITLVTRDERVRGAILAAAGTRGEIEAIIQKDPFRRKQIADYQIIEFLPSMSADNLAKLIVP